MDGERGREVRTTRRPGLVLALARALARALALAARFPRIIPCLTLLTAITGTTRAAIAETTATAPSDGGASAAGSGSPSNLQRVHVRGSARLDAHLARAGGKLVLAGAVVDDVDRPLAHARVSLKLDRAGAAIPLSMLLESADPEPCGEGQSRAMVERADSLGLRADDAGRFCIRLALPTDRYVAHLAAAAADDQAKRMDPAGIELPIDLALEAVTLRFDP